MNRALPNRTARRRHVKQAGGSWQREQEAKRRAELSDTAALQMSPMEARQMLARWAAIPGRRQADVDALNKQFGAGVMGGDDAGLD